MTLFNNVQVNQVVRKYTKFISIRIVVFLCAILINIHAKSVFGQTNDTLTILDEETIITVPAIEHSPQKAALYSAILPGLGQIYNRQAWKVLVVYAALGVSGYYVYDNNDQYNMYRDEYFRIISYEGTHGSLDENFQFETEYGLKYSRNNNPLYLQNGRRAVVHYKDQYHKWRDLSIICTLVVYGLNIIEADVSAHFFSYDISEDLSMKIEPVLMNTALTVNSPGLRISLTF